ncbi:MAG TPA: heme biosynthesis HemY N-terminal domain-containing protein [Microvirga sp.]|jgi:HemY protein|nr:heme biosynthesis HemY N-terminal domain-containing protein [Microvirga sp.]
MWRALFFIVLLAVAAYGAVWLADRPGTVLVTFGGYEVQTTVAVAAVALAGLAFALALLWAGVSTLVRLPSRLTFASRARKRAKGYQAVSRGMVAVGAGDAIAARRHANEAERLLGQEPLTLLLKAQAAQVSGNRAAAEAAFSRMMDNDETRVLGLRGLFVEARRRGDAQHATQYASEAARLAPAATWASDAVLEARSAARDWQGALAALDRRAASGLIDKATARRHRAVLLTADALDRQERDPEGALANAQEALKLAPDLVPAAAIAGRALSHRGDLRRAAKAVETAWRQQPHPDLAEVYLNLRPGDSALDRLARAETLLKLSTHAPEGRLAVARAAMEAREFAKARSVLEPLANERPTMRVCLLMSDLEQAEHGATGRGREWIARAARAPRDPAWMADGVVCDRWAPVSPVTGRLDAFVWQAPPDVLVAPELALHDEVTADLDEEPKVIPFAPPPPASAAPVAPAPEPVREEPRDPEIAVYEAPPGPAPAAAAADEKAPPKPNGAHGYAPSAVVFPVDHPPDDPGAETPEKPARRGLFG